MNVKGKEECGIGIEMITARLDADQGKYRNGRISRMMAPYSGPK